MSQSRPSQYLADSGWKMMGSQPYKYGTLYYWDHPRFQRKDGRWWVQGSAERAQKYVERALKASRAAAKKRREGKHATS